MGSRRRLAELLLTQHYVINRRQALRFVTDAVIRHRISTGRWQVPQRGVYVTHAGEISERQRLWIAVLASGKLAFLSGLTALLMHGLRGLTTRRIDVVLPAGSSSSKPPTAVWVHRARKLPDDDRCWVDGLPCAAPARAMIDAARWSRSDDEARTIVAACFQQGVVTLPAVVAALERMPKVKRRALIVETAQDAAGGAHSLGELDFLRLCRRNRLPEPECQVRRVDASGRTRYLDAAFRDWRLRVEIDGAHHRDRHQWWADLQRDNDLWISGERVLRFPVWVVREHPDDVLRQLRAALAAAGWSLNAR